MKSLVWLRNDLRMDDNPALETLVLPLKRLAVFIYTQKSKSDFIMKPTARLNLLLVILKIYPVT